MHEERFDSLTRKTAEVVSRRSSLLTLGGAAVMGALAAPAVVQAGKDAKKTRKKAKKRKKKKCNRQIDQCSDFFTTLCADPNQDCEPGELEAILFCCSQLRNCKADESVDCFFNLFVPPA